MKNKIRISLIILIWSFAFLTAFPANVQAKQSSYVITMKSIKGAKKLLPSQVTKAFKKLKFKIYLKPSFGYQGMFSVSKHRIVVKKRSKDILLHEMGHFTAYLTDRPDLKKAWKKIYRAERNGYTGYNRSYVRRDPIEYFAGSFMDYCEHPGRLKKKSPQTWAYIKSVVNSITEEDTEKFYQDYGWIW